MKPIAKRSKGLRILAAVGGLAIAAGLALAVDALRGDPLSRAWAERRAIARAEKLCPGQSFTVLDSWGGTFFNYGVTVQAADSPDTTFHVTTSFWLLTEDDAANQLENRSRTLERQGAEGAQAIEAVLDEACPQYERAAVYNAYASGELASIELDLCWTPEAPAAGAGAYAGLFTPDAPFEASVTAKVPDRLCAQILWDGAPENADFEAVADAFDAALTAAGYDIDYYDLTLVPQNASHDAIQAMDIERVLAR